MTTEQGLFVHAVEEPSQRNLVEDREGIVPETELVARVALRFDDVGEELPQRGLVRTAPKTLAQSALCTREVGRSHAHRMELGSCGDDRARNRGADAFGVRPLEDRPYFGLEGNPADQLECLVEALGTSAGRLGQLVKEETKLLPVQRGVDQGVSSDSFAAGEVRPDGPANCGDMVEERLASDVPVWANDRPERGLHIVYRAGAVRVEGEVADERTSELTQAVFDRRDPHGAEDLDSENVPHLEDFDARGLCGRRARWKPITLDSEVRRAGRVASSDSGADALHHGDHDGGVSPLVCRSALDRHTEILRGPRSKPGRTGVK